MAFEASQITRSLTRVEGFRDNEFDYQLLRVMGLASSGGSTVGECLAAAAMIAESDTGSWARVFGALADRVEAAAADCLAAGHPVSARAHLLRASTYHRAAEYYAETDPGLRGELGRRSAEAFRRAAALPGPGPTVETVAIAFEGADLPGYLVHPLPGTVPPAGPAGTLVVLGGFESTAEELYFQLGVPGADRGWEVLVFDGPGQTGCMRDHPELTFRPDYEVPVGAVLDFLQARPGTDPDRVALAGLSFGSYFAARAAAHDTRIRALVLDPPVSDLYRYMEAWLGPPVFGSRRDIRPADVDGVPEDLLLPQMVWGILAVCRRFGVSSLHRWIEALEAFRLGDSLGAIACPVLALVGEREGAEITRQTEAVVAGVAGPATLRRFAMDDGADAHGQAGNLPLSAQVVYDWLDELFVGD